VETPEQQSQETLCAEILAQAQQECERLALRARNEANAIKAQAKTEAEELRQQKMAEARTEAARQRGLILARAPLEVNRERSVAVEAQLQTIRDQARRQLVARQGFDYLETLIALASEAISRMAGDAFVVKLLPEDRMAHGDALTEAIKTRLGHSVSITVVEQSAVREGGLLVQDTQGRQVYDQHLTARLDRLWPELRRQIAARTSLVIKSATPEKRP
jgi:vacuolar-type H+-ATPase subunit E/Vma4